jgi:hypothetical protein
MSKAFPDHPNLYVHATEDGVSNVQSTDQETSSTCPRRRKIRAGNISKWMPEGGRGDVIVFLRYNCAKRFCVECQCNENSWDTST